MSKATVYDAVPEFGRLRDTVLYDDVWNQPELMRLRLFCEDWPLRRIWRHDREWTCGVT